MSEDFVAKVAEIYTQAHKHPRCRSFVLMENAKEKMLRTDILVAQLQCFKN